MLSATLNYANKYLREMSDSAKGAILICIAALLFTFMFIIIKILGNRLEVIQVVFLRQCVMICLMAPFVIGQFRQTFSSKAPKWQISRAGLAVFNVTISGIAIVNLPLAEATTISFARSFFLTFLAVLILKEVVGPRRWGAVAVGFIGIVIIMRPGGEAFSIYALYALCAAFTLSVVGILNRYLGKLDGAKTTIAYMLVFQGLVSFPFAIYYWQTPVLEEWLLIGLLGCVTLIAQFANVNAFRLGEASFLAGLDYIRLIYGVGLGWLIFGTMPDAWFYLGSSLIVAAAIYTIYRETVRQQTINADAQSHKLP